jgi:hypothetical protein
LTASQVSDRIFRMKIIGISGYAGCGKDSFFNLLQKYSPKVVRFALADALKEELKDFILSNYGLDIYTCSREEKNKLRPLLVFHAGMKRNTTNGTYWWKKLDAIIKEYPDQSKVGVITDIRYAAYKHDEVSWLKEDMGGKLVHISKFKLNPEGKKVFAMPPNKEELVNDPLVVAKSDFRVFWEDCNNDLDLLNQKNEEMVKKFIIDYVE